MTTESKQVELNNIRTAMAKKDYLGDGVYVIFDGYHVVLTTENGISVQNVVRLDDTVVESFERYLAKLKIMVTECRIKMEELRELNKHQKENK